MPDEPAGFLAALFAITALGAILPIPIDDREDHIVLALATPVVLALLGPPGLVLVVAAVAVALPVLILRNLRRHRPHVAWDRVRRQAGWTLVSAGCILAGAVLGLLTFIALGGTFPTPLATLSEMAVGGAAMLVAWLGTMTIRVMTLPRVRPSLLEASLDPVDSVLYPYLLPAVAGFPLVTAAVALYDEANPWPSVVILWWALPVYAAIALDVHRRHVARELRRDALATQRLAAIGEVSARIVHQSRHQVGLMGWSIHRLRGLVGSVDPADHRAADEELDALAGAKQRLGELLTAEVLHEPVGLGPDRDRQDTVAEVVRDVCDQLQFEAMRETVSLTWRVDGDRSGDRPAPPSLRDVVFNLVDNALDAARSSVEVVVAGRPGATSVTVWDDGPGIPPEVANRLFEPFFTSKPDGTGMGLAIAEAIMSDLGGDLGVDRCDGRTRFEVRLPLTTGAAAPAPGPVSSA